MHSRELMDLVRSLHTDFSILQRTDEALVMAVNQLEISGEICSAILSFIRPTSEWAMRWNPAKREWLNVPELSKPANGTIATAFAKPIGPGFNLSFSDEQEPIVRWGFYTAEIMVDPVLGK